jgi:hypothetical protein
MYWMNLYMKWRIENVILLVSLGAIFFAFGWAQLIAGGVLTLIIFVGRPRVRYKGVSWLSIPVIIAGVTAAFQVWGDFWGWTLVIATILLYISPNEIK